MMSKTEVLVVLNETLHEQSLLEEALRKKASGSMLKNAVLVVEIAQARAKVEVLRLVLI